MSTDFYIYQTRLPAGMKEAVLPCADGAFTIYLDERLSDEQKKKALAHALDHIRNCDWQRADVNEIEENAHFNG